MYVQCVFSLHFVTPVQYKIIRRFSLHNWRCNLRQHRTAMAELTVSTPQEDDASAQELVSSLSECGHVDVSQVKQGQLFPFGGNMCGLVLKEQGVNTFSQVVLDHEHMKPYLSHLGRTGIFCNGWTLPLTEGELWTTKRCKNASRVGFCHVHFNAFVALGGFQFMLESINVASDKEMSTKTCAEILQLRAERLYMECQDKSNSKITGLLKAETAAKLSQAYVFTANEKVRKTQLADAQANLTEAQRLTQRPLSLTLKQSPTPPKGRGKALLGTPITGLGPSPISLTGGANSFPSSPLELTAPDSPTALLIRDLQDKMDRLQVERQQDSTRMRELEEELISERKKRAESEKLQAKWKEKYESTFDYEDNPDSQPSAASQQSSMSYEYDDEAGRLEVNEP